MPPARPDAPDRLLVAGNWKMNGSRALAAALAQAALDAARAAPEVEVALFPPAVLLPLVSDAVGAPRGPVAVGGQQCHPEAKGAHTMGIAAAMLAEAGCRYVLDGHSEVRREYGYDDARVAAAAEAARAAGLRPIVCVGETRAERDAGQARAVLERQVDAVFGSRSAPLADADVAYEPVWAIGTGVTPTPEEAERAHGWIRARLDAAGAPRSRILYGGSVAPANIGGFLSRPGIDGVLVGGASLEAASFTALVVAARAAAAARRRP